MKKSVKHREYIDVVSVHSGAVLCSTRQGMDLHAAENKVENDKRIGHLSRVRVHGRDCAKAPHIGTGHLHDAKDDRPFDVDGVTYCGRCHEYLS